MPDVVRIVRPATFVQGTFPGPSPLVPDAWTRIGARQNVMACLDEGSFVAASKYALFHAIADLCVTGATPALLLEARFERFLAFAAAP